MSSLWERCWGEVLGIDPPPKRVPRDGVVNLLYIPPEKPEDILIDLRSRGYPGTGRTTMVTREKLVGGGPSTDGEIKRSLRETEGVEKETAKQRAERITGSRYEVMTADDPAADALQSVVKELQTLNRTLGKVVDLLQDSQKRPRF